MAVEDNKKENYMPTLDGMRGLACLFVVAMHMEYVFDFGLARNTLGSAGVLIFFALSGFLMGALYFDKPCNFNNASKYFISRFSRITPAYYIAIAFAVVCYWALPDLEYQMTLVNTLRSFAFIGSEGVFWSIPPEIQFYVFFFFIWYAWEKYKSAIKWPMALVIVVSLICIATKEQWGGILLPSKLHIFLYGFFGAVILRFDVVKKILLNTYFQGIIAIACVSYYHLFIVYENIYVDLLFPAMIASAVVSFSQTTILSSVLATTPMRIVGNASFSIYLFHDIILRSIDGFFVTKGASLWFVGISLIVAVGLPLAFHFWAEKPLNKLARGKAQEYLDIAVNRFKALLR